MKKQNKKYFLIIVFIFLLFLFGIIFSIWECQEKNINFQINLDQLEVIPISQKYVTKVSISVDDNENILLFLYRDSNNNNLCIQNLGYGFKERLCDEFNGEIAILKNPIKVDSTGNNYNDKNNFLLAGFKDNTDLVISKIRNCDDNMMPYFCKILPSTTEAASNLGLVSRKLKKEDGLDVIFFYLKELKENSGYSLCSRELPINNFEEENIFSQENEFNDCPSWNDFPANLKYFIIPEEDFLDRYYRAYFSKKNKLNYEMKIDYSIIGESGTFEGSNMDEESLKFDIVPIRLKSESMSPRFVEDWLFVMLLKNEGYNDTSKSFSIELKLFQAPHSIKSIDKRIPKTILTQKIDESLEFILPCEYNEQLFLTEMSCIDLFKHDDKFYMIMTVSNEDSLSSPNNLLYMVFSLDLNLKPYFIINGLVGFIPSIIFIISLFIFLKKNYEDKINKFYSYSILSISLTSLFLLIEPIRNCETEFAITLAIIISISPIIEKGKKAIEDDVKKKKTPGISEFHELRYD